MLEERFGSNMFMVNITTSPVNDTREDESVFLGYVKIFSTLPIFWLKVLPSIVFGMGVAPNFVLATYLIKYKRYRSPIFAIILSMCFADTMMCASALLWTTMRLPFLIGPAWMCPVGEEVLYASIFSSTYHMLFISIIRFYQLVFPLSARTKVTSGLMARICIGIWIFSFTSNIPFAMTTGPIYANVKGNIYSLCSFIRGDFIAKQVYLAIAGLIVPFLLIATFHVAKHRVVMKSGTVSTNSMAKDKQKRETTDTRAVMVVITVYLVSATPVTVECLLQALGVGFHPLISDTAYKIQWLNSVLNPFIYAFAAQ